MFCGGAWGNAVTKLQQGYYTGWERKKQWFFLPHERAFCRGCGAFCRGCGRRYEIDIYFKLARTDPEVYFDKWGGELWFEVYHTCRVDRNQAEDFAIENKTLFEFKIPETSCFYDYITDEGYIKRQATLKKWYSERGVKGLLICQNRGGSPCRWYKSTNGNMTARIDGTYYTVIKNKFDSNYGIMYGNGLLKWEYNQKKFQTEKEAMKMAEYFAFILYNNEKIQ